MIRSLLGLLVVIGVLLPGTILADPGPPPPTPTPHAQRTALTGRVPAPSGTAVTLKALDLNVGGIKDCETSTSRVGPDDSPDTSSFQLVLDGSCLAGAEGVFVCWSPRPSDCSLLTASAGMLRSGLVMADVPSFTELGQTLRTELLAPPVKDREEGPVNLARRAPGGTLRLADLADAGQQITDSAGSGPGQQVADLLVADLSQSEQGGRYGWLLWAGAAMLVAGLALAAGVGVRARRS